MRNAPKYKKGQKLIIDREVLEVEQQVSDEDGRVYKVDYRPVAVTVKSANENSSGDFTGTYVVVEDDTGRTLSGVLEYLMRPA